jgi:hypothetical protein
LEKKRGQGSALSFQNTSLYPGKIRNLILYFQQGPLGCSGEQAGMDERVTDGVGCNFDASLHIFDHHSQFCGSLAVLGQTLSAEKTGLPLRVRASTVLGKSKAQYCF